MRWKCICSYDGTDFNGWQSQPNRNTIQDILERRLEFIFGHPIRIHASGRTDAGVHANYQVFHFDGNWIYGADKLLRAFKCGIPKTIGVFSAEEVDDTFHARFSAIGKQYKYHILEGDASPFEYRYVWNLRNRRLDVDKMNEVAKIFLGEHDFSQFGAKHGDNATENVVKTMYEMSFSRSGTRIIFTAEGSGYLYKMVRILVGCFVQVGLGNMDRDKLVAAIAGQNKNCADFMKECAPSRGLFLNRVYY
ncbi:MAG: tRNA pseudouridine(38-40) synthase TruA [Puniceicoccales bacterium]|jgi:tRNA pseudouridine38-40 synthase|nr:tRNA pseudouridine(38-40) synthase TruA [Puniceicoccales bacterium]